jgi:hypothetical protein
VFIPDMDIALQFLEARRRAAEIERGAGLPFTGRTQAPLAIGLLMAVAPPLAVTLVWSDSRFSRTAQIALTAYGAFMTLVLAALALAALS